MGRYYNITITRDDRKEPIFMDRQNVPRKAAISPYYAESLEEAAEAFFKGELSLASSYDIEVTPSKPESKRFTWVDPKASGLVEL